MVAEGALAGPKHERKAFSTGDPAWPNPHERSYRRARPLAGTEGEAGVWSSTLNLILVDGVAAVELTRPNMFIA
jgi:hypothetical protein